MLPLVYFGDMAGFITAITGETGITSANMWAQITPAGGFIAALVIFSFGLYIIRKLVKGAAKGKAKI